jgi:hypothetical protein
MKGLKNIYPLILSNTEAHGFGFLSKVLSLVYIYLVNLHSWLSHLNSCMSKLGLHRLLSLL